MFKEADVVKRLMPLLVRHSVLSFWVHGLIQKVPHPHRYHVSTAGRAILIAVLTTAQTSHNQMNLPAKAA